MSSLTEKQSKILLYLKERRGLDRGPTDIGLFFHQPYSRASSWATAPLKKLVEMGLIVRRRRGVYKITKKGLDYE